MDRGTARNRLRALKDQEKRRVSRLAESRNRRAGGQRSNNAPTRVLVTERRTRREGLGRGGAQALGNSRRRRGGNQNNQPAAGGRRRGRGGFASKFSDQSVFRSGARDRFSRFDDRDAGANSNRRVDRRGGQKRFAKRNSGKNGRRGGNQQQQQQGRGRGRGNNQSGRGGRGGKKELSAQDLDAQLEKYNTGTLGLPAAKTKGGKKGGPVSHDDLDAQLERFQAQTAGGGATL